MRDIDKLVKVTQLITEEKRGTKQEIRTIYENKIERYVLLDVAILDDSLKVIHSERINVTGEFYDLLMSESPEFASGKPQNEYREIDLWHIIDQMNEE